MSTEYTEEDATRDAKEAELRDSLAVSIARMQWALARGATPVLIKHFIETIERRAIAVAENNEK